MDFEALHEALKDDSNLQPFISVLRAIQQTELWEKLLKEIDPLNPDEASDYLSSILRLADEFGDDSVEALTDYEVIWAALHNVVGCDAVKPTENNELGEYAQMIPCTRLNFRICKSTVGDRTSYFLVTDGSECRHVAKLHRRI